MCIYMYCTFTVLLISLRHYVYSLTHYFYQASKSGPFFHKQYHSTGLKIDLIMNTFAIEVSTGSVSHLLGMVEDITSVIQ